MPLPPPQDPWTYTRPQRIGLLALCIVLVLGYGISRRWSGTQPIPTYDDHDGELFAAAAALRGRVAAEQTAKDSDAAEGFFFDPNSVSPSDLRRLGLSAKQAQAFTRYRDKVTLRGPDDLGRLRVLQPHQVSHLQRWATFPAARAAAQVAAVENTALRFPFDPNTLTVDSLQLLGLSRREAVALDKYRSYRPRTFRRPADLQKVRALSPAKVKELIPWVRLAGDSQSLAPAPRRPDTLARRAPQAIDINRAQADGWQQLPGIGPARAQRILRYRELLGGFHSAQQVGETYGLPDSVFERILPLLRESAVTRPLYVNRGQAEELAAHPYLPRTQAVILVRYRDNHGPFTSVEDLKNVRAISTETLDKLLPYLNFDP